MISVDISNVWGPISLPDLLAVEKEISQAHLRLTEESEEFSDCLGWLKLPLRKPTAELLRLQKAADKIREDSDVCVVVGIGGSCLGAQAAIELLQGPNRNIGRGKGNPQIFYAGNSLSTRQWNELTRLLEGKDFSVVVISKSGVTLEPAIAFRGLRWLLERRCGSEEAARRIYAVTDPCSGPLRQMAQEQGWETFSIPPTVGGRYSVLTPAGLLPMAVAGIDIMQLLAGAADAKDAFDLRSFENPVWLYAAVRNVLWRNGKQIELLVSSEPGFRAFTRWWQHLFAEAEGKQGKGLFPVGAEFPADLHTLGQMIQDGQRTVFETMLRFAPCDSTYTISSDVNDPEGLNRLAGMTLEQVEQLTNISAVDAHVDGNVPVISVECDAPDERNLGGLFYFFQLSSAISACTMGVDPFRQPGMEPYKRNLSAQLNSR